MNIKALKERLADRYDPDYLVDILMISSEELLDAFEDKLLLMRDEFPEVEDLMED